MKQIFQALAILSFLIIGCDNSKSDSSKTTSGQNTSNSTNEETASTSNTATTSTDPQNTDPGSLIGTWQLQLDAYDDNNNQQLDPEERAKATPNKMSYQFKPDGSCVIQGMFKGRYELKKMNGKDQLSVYRERIPQEEEKDPDPDHYRILSHSGTELVLLMVESHYDNTIWIFKRI